MNVVTPPVSLRACKFVNETMMEHPYQADLGVQVRYEINRRIGPYVDLSRTFYPNAASGGERPATLLRAGLRVIF